MSLRDERKGRKPTVEYFSAPHLSLNPVGGRGNTGVDDDGLELGLISSEDARERVGDAHSHRGPQLQPQHQDFPPSTHRLVMLAWVIMADSAMIWPRGNKTTEAGKKCETQPTSLLGLTANLHVHVQKHELT